MKLLLLFSSEVIAEKVNVRYGYVDTQIMTFASHYDGYSVFI